MTPEKEEQLFKTVESISERLDTLTIDVEKFNDRFNNYQQATQWVVQLAFSLIASATVIIIISNVLVDTLRA